MKGLKNDDYQATPEVVMARDTYEFAITLIQMLKRTKKWRGGG